MIPFDKIQGCIIGGAIGDALGSQWENSSPKIEDPTLFVWGQIEDSIPPVQLTDDTQLTIATCQSILKNGSVSPEEIANEFLRWYKLGKLSGLGSATLQALIGLNSGGHYALVGKKGEMAAGNGAAMRIAPLALFHSEISRDTIRQICRITHHNEEAYVGALAVYLAIRESLKEKFGLNQIIPQLPDSIVRDQLKILAELVEKREIAQIAKEFGNSGYVAESVPLALFAAMKFNEIGFEKAMNQLIEVGGDTDTNASIFGQIVGAEIGYSNLPQNWTRLVENLNDYQWIKPILNQWKKDRT